MSGKYPDDQWGANSRGAWDSTPAWGSGNTSENGYTIDTFRSRWSNGGTSGYQGAQSNTRTNYTEPLYSFMSFSTNSSTNTTDSKKYW